MSDRKREPTAGGAVLVSVDVGTGGARAVAWDLAGRVVGQARRAYRTHSPRPGVAEQNPDDWANCAVEALQALGHRLPETHHVLSIGLTGQSPTVAPFDRMGRPVGPGMLYRDNRAIAEAAEMRERIGRVTMHTRTGHIAEAFHVGPKVLWLRRHAPQVFGRTTRLLQPRDVVLRRLTGREATDETHANATLFFDLRERRWATDLLAPFDLDPALFPEAIAPWSVAGQLRKGLGRGLPAGLPIVIGAADSQCAAFGAGVTDPGPVSEMAGSSSCLNSTVVEPLPDLRIAHYSHVVSSRFTTEVGVNTAGAALDWAVHHLGYYDYKALAAEATRFWMQWSRLGRRAGDPREAAPLFVPYLGDGERDVPTMRGGFVGLSLRHDRSALAYSVLEGVALAVWRMLVVLEQAGGPLTELHVSGGGSRLQLTGQLKADLLDRPVLHLSHDATAIGTAMLAAGSVGLAREAREVIDQGLGRAQRFEPTEWGREVAQVRGPWFVQVVREPAMHLAGPAPQ